MHKVLTQVALAAAFGFCTAITVGQIRAEDSGLSSSYRAEHPQDAAVPDWPVIKIGEDAKPWVQTLGSNEVFASKSIGAVPTAASFVRKHNRMKPAGRADTAAKTLAPSSGG